MENYWNGRAHVLQYLQHGESVRIAVLPIIVGIFYDNFRKCQNWCIADFNIGVSPISTLVYHQFWHCRITNFDKDVSPITRKENLFQCESFQYFDGYKLSNITIFIALLYILNVFFSLLFFNVFCVPMWKFPILWWTSINNSHSCQFVAIFQFLSFKQRRPEVKIW